jgi:hypothetical protein
MISPDMAASNVVVLLDCPVLGGLKSSYRLPRRDVVCGT